jgi:SAM-dependent methyltransferase
VVIANRKARDAGLSTRFYAADIYDLPGALSSHERAEGFDIVFTGGGALVWLPDIIRWSQVVFALLKPGGHLLLIEEHPVSGCLWVHDGQVVVETDYFGRSKPFIDTGWAHFKGGEDAHEIKNEFAWPLGDVVTALCGAGMVIERLEEFPGGPEWRFGERQEDSRHLPGEYLLLARRPA